MKQIFTLLCSFIILTSLAQSPVMNPISGPTVICSSPSAPTSFTASASNSPTSYAWSVYPYAGVNITNDSSSISTISFPLSNGTFTIYCSANNAFGTSPTESYVVTVFETPNVSFSGSNTFCQGSSTNLSASSTILAASPTISYNWAPSYGLNTNTGSNVIANPSVPTNYTVTATKGFCKSTAEIMVAPFETMSVTFSGANTYCQGSSTNLTASSNVQSASSTISYFWSPSYGLNTTYGPNVTANPATSTNYTVTAYYGACSNNGQIIVGPNSFTSPTVTAMASNSLVCMGDSTTLTASGADTYTWTNNVQNAIPFAVYNTNTYYVTGTDLNGCTNTASVNVSVNPLAYFNVYSSNNPIPPGSGQSSTLTIYGNAGASYSLNASATSTTIIVSPTVTTTYTFTSINSSGCEYTVVFTQYVGYVTGIQPINEPTNDYFSVYPNPNNGVFQIKSSTRETIRIINQLGEIVRVIDLNPEMEFQVADLSAGIYVIQSNKTRVKIIVTQ